MEVIEHRIIQEHYTNLKTINMIPAEIAKKMSSETMQHYEKLQFAIEDRIKEAVNRGDFFIIKNIPRSFVDRIQIELDKHGYIMSVNSLTEGSFKISWE